MDAMLMFKHPCTWLVGGWAGVTKMLVQSGADVSKVNRSGTKQSSGAFVTVDYSSILNGWAVLPFASPFHMACARRHIEVAKVLFESRADPYAENEEA